MPLQGQIYRPGSTTPGGIPSFYMFFMRSAAWISPAVSCDSAY